MTAAFDLDGFASSVLGLRLDEDGIYPGECHDLWLKLLYELGGRPGWGYAPEDATVSVWSRFPHNRGLLELFEKRAGIDGLQPGDVVFWRHGRPFPGSHVAIALGPVRGGVVRCLTQNPGPVQIADLTTTDIVGYLRPRRTIAYGGITIGDDDMSQLAEKQIAELWEYLLPGKSGVKPQGGGDKRAATTATQVATLHDSIQYGKAGVRQAGVLVAALAAVQAEVAGLRAAVQAFAPAAGVDPAVVERTIREAIQAAGLSTEAIADAAADELGKRIGGAL